VFLQGMNMSGGAGGGVNSTSARLAKVDQSKSWKHFLQPDGDERRGVKRTSSEMVSSSARDP
jgi:hypothetical protein